MRAVSLFSGCLGFDLGLERLGIDAACYVENDKDCLRLIRARRPDVRIVEDVLLVDAKLEDDLGPVDLVAGGFPCQDLSYAGRGAGLDGSRSGLWFEMARIVRDLRPALVLVENVPGLLTRGLGVVTHELAAAGYVGRWFTLGAVDVGAPHRRERVFVTARKVEAGVDPSVFDGPHPSGLFDASGWLPPQESLFDVEPLPRLGKRGRWTLDSIWEEDARQAIDDDSDETLLPTPAARDGKGANPNERDGGLDLPGAIDEVKLLPTPTAGDSKAGGSRNLEGSKAHAGESLTDVVQTGNSTTPRLLPTPTAEDGERGRNGAGTDRLGAMTFDDVPLLPTPVANPDNPGSGGELRAALEHGPGRRNETGVDSLGRPNLGRPSRLLPTPTAQAAKHGEPTPFESSPDREDKHNLWETAAKLLPTPQAADGAGGRLDRNPETLATGKRPSGTKAAITLATAVDAELLPTPTAGDGDRSSEQFSRHYAEGADNPTLLGSARRSATSWGVYEPAIRRWEETLGRAAPAPTDEKGRLSPWFVEWMMGEPDGWTDLDGISRTARLRMLGNAVQSQVGYRVGLRLFALDQELAGERTTEAL